MEKSSAKGNQPFLNETVPIHLRKAPTILLFGENLRITYWGLLQLLLLEKKVLVLICRDAFS